MMQCKQCRYFHECLTGVGEHGVYEGLCRRNPPTIDEAGFPQFPPVHETWWCGEWSPGDLPNAPTLEMGIQKI